MLGNDQLPAKLTARMLGSDSQTHVASGTNDGDWADVSSEADVSALSELSPPTCAARRRWEGDDRKLAVSEGERSCEGREEREIWIATCMSLVGPFK